MISRAFSFDGFVGRREELGVLHDEFERACSGRARLVCIEGEAGIGKSRLMREFAGRIEGLATAIFANNGEHVRAPYEPFFSLMTQLGIPKRGASDKAAFFERTAAALTRASMQRPIVATIEDLHWADAATLELLAYLMDALGRARVLLVATLRADGADAAPALAAFRHRAARHRARSLALRGLRTNDVRAMVALILAERGETLAMEAVAQIESLSEGHPLYVEELVSAGLEDGGLDLARRAPLSLQATIAERLAPMLESERDLLVRAATIGQRFSATFLATIAERPLDEILHVLQRAAGAGVVVPEPGSLDVFRFRHAMIRQTLADRLILALAAPLHLKIARELESLGDATARASELAYHWSQARDAQKARYYNESAAEQACAMYAYRDAIGFYSAALRWEYPAGAARARLYERLGTMLYVEGCGQEPSIWFEKSREEYERIGDVAGTAAALLRLADQHWVDARTRSSLEAASHAAAISVSLGDPAISARALLSLARFSATLGDAAGARSFLARALPLEDFFDAELQASFHEVRAETNAAAGDYRAALRDCRTASRRAAAGESELVAQVENNFALVAADAGELALALERHDIALREARRTRMLWRVAYCALNHAQTLALRGELHAARRLVWEALECGVTTETFKTKATAVGIPLALRLNDRALLEACTFEGALESARLSGELQRLGGVCTALAELAVSRGARDGALDILRDALATLTHDHRCWSALALAARLGSERDARDALAILSRSNGRPALQRAREALLRAFALGHAGAAAARRHALAAARVFERFGYQLDRALALEAAGEPRLALEIYERCGSVADAARLGRLEPDRREAPRLSPRQLEIARLVAQGGTNKHIAASLHISEHTVEHHVSAIFEKLGVRSRAALAARMSAPVE